MKLYPRFSKYSSGWQGLKEISVIIYSPVRPLSAWIYLLEVREQLLNIYILLTQGRRIKVKDFIGLQHFRVRFSPSLKCSSLARDYSCVKCSMTNNLIWCFVSQTCLIIFWDLCAGCLPPLWHVILFNINDHHFKFLILTDDYLKYLTLYSIVCWCKDSRTARCEW